METQPAVSVDHVDDRIANAQGPATHRWERRTAVRYPLEVPVVFQWTERGHSRESRGRTRDVSVRGMFVLSGDCPPYGTSVAIKMNFPAALSGRTGWIHAVGLALRVERRSAGLSGFVVESNGPRLFIR